MGDGTVTDRNTPTDASGGTTSWSAITAGGDHTLALRSNGTLWAWGDNEAGQSGWIGVHDDNRSTPAQIGSATNWSAIAGGASHSLGLKSNGTLWAWGDNSYMQLGDGTDSNRSTPTQIGSATNWTSISVGEYHSVALKSNGTLWAWGDNSVSQLGDGTQTDRNTPTQIGSDTNWSSLATGANHTIARK